eukprot:CAMPEP_0116017398 /NCGR_PEP_ID=MMETSP0321-20121206/8025_1 /TAXON_ID=163516 /ORGANISM="Leptocylindrus danicus var. danicus, Strain B650" /LENGTH=2622 /DNA_ID=CAMNT_0003487585 /DNA_START=222 /DNA_END=8087 /DNA_ORIENTATION=-
MSASSEDEENAYWECEACRCHTNTEATDPVSCGVCGTRRRAFFARGSGIMGDNMATYRRNNVHRYGIGLMQNAEGEPYRINEEQSSDSSSSLDQECVSEEHGETSAKAALVQAMNEDEARRYLDKVTSASKDHPDVTIQWNSQYKGSRVRVLDSVKSNEVVHGHIALMTEQGKPGEGSCVRSNAKIPNKECFGWKIVFEYAARGAGKSMGGCYLVGVVSHKFSDYSERLQESNYFYGIEDGGRRYEGDKSKRGSNSLHLSRKDAPRNSENVLFGNREIITVVADMSKRNLNFWRDDVFLGTLVRNLPEDEYFYPVAAPFNSGVCVVISSLREDPLSTLSSYHAGLSRKRVTKRQEILAKKGILIKNGGLATDLVHVLQHIFSWYQKNKKGSDAVGSDSGMKLNVMEASQLWYRCGLRLSGLINLIKSKEEADNVHSITDAIFVYVEDFINAVRQIVADEEEKSPVVVADDDDPDYTDGQTLFQVGDTVEVLNHLNDYGCTSGHLLPGDRGIVTEVVKHKPPLVRVKFAGKRSTYRGAEIATERSGLIVCTAVYFLSTLLHAHGYSSDLQPLWGKQVEKDICKDGDLIMLKTSEEAIDSDAFRILGRISLRPYELTRKRSLVSVCFFDRSIDLRAEDLLFTTFFHKSLVKVMPSTLEKTRDNDIHKNFEQKDDISDPENGISCMDGVNDQMRKKVELVAKADKDGILAVTKDCKDIMKISNFYRAGLHLSILSAIGILSKSSRNDGPVVALLNLILVFVSGICDGGSKGAKVLLTSPIFQEASAHSIAERPQRVEVSDLQSLNLHAMERLLSSALRGDHGVNVRDLIRDVSSGSDRRRNILLALMASTQSEDPGFPHALNDISLSQPSLYEQVAGDSPRLLSRIHQSLGDSSLANDASKSTTSQLMRATSSTGRSIRISTATRSLIHDGLLVNSLSWVGRALRNGADVNCFDEEGNTILFLSVSMGCGFSIVKALVYAGAVVSQKEIEYAARTDQLQTLELLLQHVFYVKEMFHIGTYSEAVREVFDAAERRQLLLKADISKAMPKIVSQIFQEIMVLALVSHEAKKNITDSLVGDVLLHAVVENQGIVDCYSDDSLNDIRTPVFLGIMSQKSAFLDIVPAEIIVDALKEEATLSAYLRLTETYLWSKDISSIATGLTLACKFINGDPSHCRQLSRFGFKELADDHKALADDMLLDLCDPSMMNDEFEVKCAKKHKTIIHLTKHSQFRCDLCGLGVDQGKPMHGCRQCDWDACELCTDKAQGGIAKWNYIRNKAEEFLNRFDPNQNSAEMSKEVHDVATKLKAREPSSIEELAALLSGGKITLFEFSSAILPPLFSALVPLNSSIMVQENVSRRNKKARVGATHVSWKQQQEKLMDRLVAVLLRDSKFNVQPTVKTSKQGEAVEKKVSNIIEYIHTVLAFKENASVKYFSNCSLQSLLDPLTITVLPAQASTVRSSTLTVHAEPLMPYAEFHRHILRCCAAQSKQYLTYCRRLAVDRAIIAERPQTLPESGSVGNSTYEGATTRRIAMVISYHEETGAHVVRYATQVSKDVCIDELEPGNVHLSSEDVLLVLASRDYYILHRGGKTSEIPEVKRDEKDRMELDKTLCMWKESIHIDGTKRFRNGSRVQCDLNLNQDWDIFTVISASMDSVAASKAGDLDSSDDYPCSESPSEWRYNLVSDEGKVALQVPGFKIRGCDYQVEKISRSRLGSRESVVECARRGASQRGRVIEDIECASSFHSDQNTNSIGVMKRCWSALSLADGTKPLDINVESTDNSNISTLRQSTKSCQKMSIGNVEYDFDLDSVEMPPTLTVELIMDGGIDPISLGIRGTTMFSALQELASLKRRRKKELFQNDYRLFYQVSMFHQENNFAEKTESTGNRSKISISPCPTDQQVEDVCGGSLCELGSSCMMCLKLLDAFSNGVKNRAKKSEEGTHEAFSSILVSDSLTNKLLNQLEDPLSTASGSLPSWCWTAPMASPSAFSYESRKMLLERTAFGVSRAVLRQQEAKVAVEGLRERMTVLRGRAVALVGEAFSGGAADPTALQLQADEIYGMEEALAVRVSAAFRAQNWEEQSLLCAKAAVRRTELLEDAASVMEQYSHDYRTKKRRLEVRFEGESGFDAASGTEAGVTRGFYADVAEALLSRDNVLGSTPLNSLSSMTVTDGKRMHQPLPLWISDVDESDQAIVPTPRADPGSWIGIYPRPLGPGSPWKPAVLQKFRFIGRLFAAALRDGFVFPLPLSASFLKLVQGCTQICSTNQSRRRPSSSSGSSTETSHSSLSSSAGSSQIRQISTKEGANTLENLNNIPYNKGSAGAFDSRECRSEDLPRPGFLGGEVFAAEAVICSKLDEIYRNSCLSEKERVRRREQVANDPSFAREAFGKVYDCSFIEYFDGRIFVDPLDPSQDANAHPLCIDFDRPITIDNVQEWVYLSKQFILFDGVIDQARAFRQGINDFFPAESLSLFSPDELQNYACGSGDCVDQWNEDAVRALLKLDGGKGAAEALVAVAAMGGEGGAALSRRFGPNSPTIGYLVRALLEAGIKERRQFLSFVTSVPIVTPGKIEVVPIVSPMGDFLPMNDPSCLPRSNTCARRLYIPKFDSYDMFSKVFWAVVKEESRFKGFYEW